MAILNHTPKQFCSIIASVYGQILQKFEFTAQKYTFQLIGRNLCFGKLPEKNRLYQEKVYEGQYNNCPLLV